MELYYTFSVLIVLTAIFSYLNLRFLPLPGTIGVMVIALCVSVGLVATGRFLPHLFTDVTELIRGVDLTEILLGAMLNFLLFAGAIHIRLADLKEQRRAVVILSTVSVVISTVVVGVLSWYVLSWLNMSVSLVQCLVFGALISPTDPIAVMSILKKAGAPKSIETKIAGESLFNDGVAVVVFITLLELARTETLNVPVGSVFTLLAKEVFGGIAVGALLGYLATAAMKRIDNYQVEVLITLAIVMGGYLLAQSMHISGPLTMVVAGLVVGNFGRVYAMSETSRDYVDKFWELIDEIMNACLFLLIGFELLMIPDLARYWQIGLVSIVVVLLARLVSIWLPARVIRFRQPIDRKSLIVLVWGGLRGGVSVALALAIDEELNREIFLAITYFVVVFSIIVQGLTIGKLVKKMEG
jgi:CPA1 family monovalent cation:H+ antiporter